MLLDAGADPSAAVYAAVVYQALESLRLLLEGDLWYFRHPAGKLYGHWSDSHSLLRFALRWRIHRSHFDPRILQLLIEHFARARTELMETAKQHLSSSQLEDLGWSDHRNTRYKVDYAARSIYHKLQEMGVSCRKKIFPGLDATIYHTPLMVVEAAECLWEAGFREIDEYDEKGITPLLISANHCTSGGWLENYLLMLWFLQHGAKNLTFPVLNNNTLVHKLAANIAAGWSEISQVTSTILRLSMDCLSSYPEDDCTCYCSWAGCSPVTALTKHISHWNHPWRISGAEITTWWDLKQDLFHQWTRDCPESLSGRRAFADLCRIELFERLGMRHTCCRFVWGIGFAYTKGSVLLSDHGHWFETLDSSEVKEFRDEDALSRVKLDRLMELYEGLELKYQGEFERFWGLWWKVLNDYVPMEVFLNDHCSRQAFLYEPYHQMTRIWPEGALPMPFDSLDEALAEIRRHVIRSMVLSRYDDECSDGHRSV
jgi:hypothetical protein